MPLHRNEGKSNASLHRFAFWSADDPADTYGTGSDGVEPGQAWIEHDSGDPDSVVDVKIRNEANDGWVSVLVVADHTHTGDEVLVTYKEEVSATYTLVLADAGKFIDLTDATDVTLTVPLNASVAFPLGTSIIIRQGGAGPVLVVGDSGVTIETEGDRDTTVGQYAVATLTKIGTDTWSLYGALEAAT